MTSQIVKVTLAINLGAHPVQGVRTKELYFSGYPSTDDLKSAVEGEWSDFVGGIEVDEIIEYKPDFLEGDNFIAFDVALEDVVGNVLVEGVEVLDSSGIEV